MATDWNAKKDMTVKRRVTRDVVGLFPDCRGEHLCLMTSLSFNELQEMVKQDKIDGMSFLCNVDNLSSMKAVNPLESKSERFSREWKRKSGGIFRRHGMNPTRSRLVFKNLFALPLNVLMEDGGRFKVVYADTCNTITDGFMDWINCGATVDGVEDDGVFAFTVILNHNSASWLDNVVEQPIDSSVFQFSACKYNGIDGMMHYAKKLSRIKSAVESKGLWKVERLIHYCEQNMKSQMATVICKKAKYSEKGS